MLAATGPSTAAAASEPSLSGENEAITFDPAIVFESGSSGGTIRTGVTILNQTRTDAAFTVVVEDAEAGSGSAATKAFEYVPIGEAPRGAGAWIVPSSEAFSIPGGQQQRIGLEVVVPEGTGAGGWYGALRITALPAEPGRGQFEFGAVAHVPVLLTVDGASAERDLRVAVEPERRVRWSGGTATWTVELRNEGDLHEVLAGRVRLDSAFTGAASVPLRPLVLLPGEVRMVPVRFDLRSAPDAWRARATIEREDGNGDRVASSPRTWVLPWWIPLLLGAVVALVAWRVRVRSGS